MADTSSLNPIAEGGTTVFVYTDDNTVKKGPGKKQHPSFYNPAMTMNRDSSILVVQQLINKRKKTVEILDGMAATGIRGFRFINELTGDFSVTINDWGEKSYQLIEENIRHIPIKNHQITNEDIHVLLSKNHYDYIDIDPFGSPAVFIDSALRSIRNNGIIAVSATDTATLCGVYPKVCLRRYNSLPLHGPCMHETALRVLIGFIGRQAGKYEKGVVPVFSYGTDHYFRLYLRIKSGVNQANHCIKQIHTLPSSKVPFQKEPYQSFGPVWTGTLHDKIVLSDLLQIIPMKSFDEEKPIRNLLKICEQEALMPPFYFSTTLLSKQFKTSAPPLDEFLKTFEKKGFFITKTQFDPTGFKTNASRKDIETLFLNQVENDFSSKT